MEKYICGGDKYTCGKGYIMMPIELGPLPDKIELDGKELSLKGSFHISLVCMKNILPNQNRESLEQMVIDKFCKFVSENEISFSGFIDEFRLAKFNERETLVARCNVSNLENFLHELSSVLKTEVSNQPTHVTLYTLQPDTGIGLNSFGELEAKSLIVNPPDTVKKALGL